MERERLKNSIGRFDHYFDSVNNKTVVYISINTFLAGGLLAGYFVIEKYICEYQKLFDVLISLELLMGLVSLIILVYASIPHLSPESKSLLYFGNIGDMDYEDFTKLSKNQDKKGELTDLRSQVHTLSKGLKKKFTRLQYAGYFLLGEFILLAPIIIIFLINKL